jgi:hypothetical protein
VDLPEAGFQPTPPKTAPAQTTAGVLMLPAGIPSGRAGDPPHLPTAFDRWWSEGPAVYWSGSGRSCPSPNEIGAKRPVFTLVRDHLETWARMRNQMSAPH